MIGTIISWICIIVGLLYLQYKSHQEIKELKIKYISQEEEIKKLKEEVYSISFAYHASYPINSKKLVLDFIPGFWGDLKHYYKLEKLRLSFVDSNYLRDNVLGSSLLSQLTNKHVKLLMIVDPCADMLKVVKQFPNLEELIVGFRLHADHCRGINVNEPDLSHLIYPSKIKKIVLVRKNNIDISPVISYYRQQNKEVIIDEISSYGDILTKYDFY
jgi:hypothetical protein